MKSKEVRKVLCFMVLVCLLIPSLVLGGEKQLNATWQQVIPDPNDLAGWRLYKGTASGGPYILEKTITYVSTQSVYEDTFPVTVPNNIVTMLYFVITAFDTDGNESGYSNEAVVRIDFMPPASPFEFKFKVVTVP